MGGAERYLLTLLPELKKRNIEVGFFCTRQQNNHEIVAYFTTIFSQFGIPVYVFDSSSSISIKAAHCLSQIIKKEEYTILSAHLIHAEIISALSKMLFKTNCNLVTTKHGYLQKFMDVHGLNYKKINKLSFSYQVEKFLQHFVSKNFAVSKGLSDFYTLSGICTTSKMEVIYHGIETEIDPAINPALRYAEHQILIFGRLRKFKGHHFLMEAMRIITVEIPSVKLIILGTGEELANLKNKMEEYKLNQWIDFLGFTDNVYEHIKNCDLVIAPSIAEPFGLVVLEAYRCSKPVVAFNVTAFNENIIDNETGSLAKPYDTTELAQKIIYLLHNKKLAVQFGLQGKNLLKNQFSLENSITNTIQFFKSV